MYWTAIKTALFLMLLAGSVRAQTAYEQVAQTLVGRLLADSLYVDDLVITTQEYHLWLDNQKISAPERNAEKERFLNQYSTLKAAFVEACVSIHADLALERQADAVMSAGRVQTFPEEGLRNLMGVQVRINYRAEGDQEPMYLYFTAIQTQGGSCKILDEPAMTYQ
jgi:hypothetical protein